ncbi:protein FAR1-RELATED SEQUENCE 8-like [Chenopodium quinoa]|uniref:protein FAR1-RELATED SEQUENCE 8-like n=1 Tax=Chenopodium quinoa TaxID=63459 RepID=UPI000B770155|nr:protein FAR1-RELATED SEQUENCE 8-like [Chenopodium quinoa]
MGNHLGLHVLMVMCISRAAGPQLRQEEMSTLHTVVSSNKVNVVHTVECPKVGMVFSSWKDVESYLKEYGEQCGFGITRVQGSFSKKTDKKDKERRGSTWRCECWGRPDMRAVREAKKRAKAMKVSGSVGAHIAEPELNRGKRKSKKCECGWRIYASVNSDGDWELKTVILKHNNHKPDPSQADLVKEYRMKQLTKTLAERLMVFYEEGVLVSRIHVCFAAEMGDGGKMKMTVKDMQHEVYKARRLKMEGGDSAAMMSYFEYMMADNHNFFYVTRLDENGRLKDVLWVDARSRAAYEYFGDVVCFDATYLTNEFALPFANFVGVNHHGQSILLGSALVSHEDSDTFRWIFKQWLSCMGGKAPIGILTDQAPAMRKPLEELMPHTQHRWCIWHITSKFGDKLGKCPLYAEFKSLLKSVIYESFTPEEFERNWCSFIKEYELENNEWLSNMFQEREMWVPAYMKEFFWAGMKTTQRVESINSFFDGYVSRKTKLHEFPRQYTRAMTKRVKDETDADANCKKYIRRLVSGFKLEKLFQKIYTDTKFQEIQTELSRLMYCYCRDEKMITETVVQYLVEDRVWIIPEGEKEEIITDRRRFYQVTFDSISKEVFCDCRKFESCGIMCKHMFRILDQNLVFDIPEKYILTRWRKDVQRRHTRVTVPYHDPSKTVQVKRFNAMLSNFESICEVAANVDDDTVLLVMKTLSKLKTDVDEAKQKREQLRDVCEVVKFPTEVAEGLTSSSIRKPYTPSQSTVFNEEPSSQQDETDFSADQDNVPETVCHPPPSQWQQSQKTVNVLDPVTNKR